MPYVEQDTEEDVEEEEYIDRGVVYYSGFCEFLEWWTANGDPKEKAPFGWCGTPRAPSSSSSGRRNGCWLTTTSLNSCFDLVKVDGPGVGTTPSDYRHAVRVASPELARMFHEE